MDYLNYNNRRVITIKPTVDIVFKRLFGNEKNKEILVHFLNSILKYYGHFDFNINNIKFIDKELRAESLKEEFPNADILVSKFKRLKKRKLLSGDVSEEKDEELINIEIHVSNVGSMLNQSEFYASRLMSNTVSKGRVYEVIPEIIMINILNYKMFDDRIGYRYFPRNDDDISDEEENLWIKFLNNPNDPIFRNEDTEDVYKKARSELLLLQDDEKFKKEYNSRIDSIITEKSSKQHYWKKGKEEGREEGRKEGRKEGEEIGEKKGIRKSQIKTTFKFFHSNFDSSFIKTLSELPENEINIIDEFLKESERNATDLAEKLNIDANFIYETCDSFKISYYTSIEDNESKSSKKIKI
ncbi:hypothetical protein BCR36DRAFT_341455 [Piromyces finnis]|uniref:Essential protein Yae1 N-terminal domain-containing protein n=1 Tax=Piromyces finnis TaxID=1754191 RepID=A0A1Y1VPF9_9FUNG|nr:hypothetical protein BCR36DRAFT_341455 [Piromyces finnis]|eukprot:ORX61140.1 hypothetical protein BCR36DRAFT_341455 [Piromyces finnis]